MAVFKEFRAKLFSEITEIPPLLLPSRIPSLDGLRAIFITVLMGFHMALHDNHWDEHSIFLVNIFFVISGFIITTLLLKERCRTGAVSLKKFYTRRFLKIIPVAYIYLAAIALINLKYKVNQTNELVNAAVFLKNSTIISTGLDWTTGHFWSLSVEEQFYIFFPFLVVRHTNAYLKAILVLLLVIPVLLSLEAHDVGVFNTLGAHEALDFLRYMTPILVGSLCSLLVFKKIITKRFYPNNVLTNLLILLAAYATCISKVDVVDKNRLWTIYHPDNITLVSSILTGIFVMNNIFDSKDLFFRIVNSRPLVAMGLASYSIYVWQQVFLLEIPWRHAFPYSGTLWFNLPALALVSFLSYYFVERNLAKVKIKLMAKNVK